MLEVRWRQTLARHGRLTAFHEVATGRRWTFAELAAAADEAPPSASGLVCPSGHGVEFILGVLQAWRADRVLCPLEPGQPSPSVPLPPPGITHLKLTSGTSAAAKCVAFTGAQLAADADAIVATMELDPQWPNLGVISLAHSYGFSNLVLPLLLHGIPLVLAPSPLPAALAAVVSAHPNTRFTLPAVPAMWRAWQDAGVIPRNLHRAISAGAPLPLALEEAAFASTRVKLHNFLGASECGGIAYDAGSEPRTDASFVGHPLREVRLTRDADGCLEVRGPAVGTGYWPAGDACLGEGRFRTTDLVELDADGGLLLRGRAGDVINVAGRKLSPETVELELLRNPAVRTALVLGLPLDGSRGDTVAAVVELAGAVSETELRDFLLARLPAWQVPRVWQVVDVLAASQRGKLSRAEWRARLLKDRMANNTPAT